MILTPTLPPLEDESLFSWCARLADFHAGRPCNDWLSMLEISRQSVMDHYPACIDRLVGLTGFSRSRVTACGIERLTAAEVATRLGIDHADVAHLRDARDPDGHPLLSAIETSNARGTIPYRYSDDAVARFAACHVSLPDLAKERGLSARAMAKTLRDLNIETIIQRNQLQAAIYRCADL